jgi:ABC-type glycerol-3-phosphate transport system permease component
MEESMGGDARPRAIRTRGQGWVPWQVQERIYQVVIAAVLLLIGAVFLFPYYYMVVSSLRAPFYNFDAPTLNLWPRPASLAGYDQLLQFRFWAGTEDEITAVSLLLRGVKNTMFQEVTILLGSTLTSLLAAYAFAKHEFRGRQFLFYLMLAGMIIPGEVTLVPKYVMFTNWGLIKTHWALIIPGVMGAGGWFLMRMFMSTVPNAYVDAARIDGAGEFRIVWDVIAPLCMPVILTNGLFSFLGIWNDLMGPLMYVYDRGKFTLQLAIYVIQSAWGYTVTGSNDTTGLHVQTSFASLVMTGLPTMLVFVMFQRYITEGTVITGLKL